MKTPSPLPRSTTLVSPVTMATPAAAAAAPHGGHDARRVVDRQPSSRMKPAESASGRAPHMARSFTVPWTASEPMSPPGKKSGRDDEGVGGEGEPAPPMRAPPGRASAASVGLSKAGRKRSRSAAAESLRPPPPWPMTTVLRANRAAAGEGEPRRAWIRRSGRGGGSGSRRRRRPRRRPWARRAGARACSARRRRGSRAACSPAEHSPRCRRRAPRRDAADVEDALGVERGVLLAQAPAARGDLADAAPLPVGDLEDLREHPARLGLPSRVTARVLVLHLRRGPLELRARCADACRRSSGSKPVTVMGTR
jgi:hypothetical protein